MAAPNSTNEVTARKLASFATSLWTKLKSWFARKEDGVYYVVGTHSYTAYSTSATYAKYTSGAYTSANSCVYNGVAYYCSTAITTPEAWTSSHWTKINTPTWEGSIDGVTELTAGLKISYKIPIAGGQSSTYLNINNLGNKYVKRCTGNTTTHLPVNTVVFMTYDGTQWVWADYSVGDNYYTNVMAYCGTVAGTQAKTATSTGFNLAQSANIPFVIRFTNANSYNGALTLNINSQGAKALWINGSASSSSNKTIAAGVYWCYFDGTQFQLWTDKSFPCPAGMRGDVTGTAAYASNAAPDSNLATLLNGFGSSISGLTSAVGGKAALDQNPSRVVYYGTTTKGELIAIIDAGYQPICYYTQSAGGSAWFTYSGKKNGYYFFYAPILWQGVVRTQWLACHSESGNTIWEYAYIDMTADGAAVADVNYDSTHNMITKTKNGQTNDVTSLQEMLQHLPFSGDDVPQSVDGSAYVLPMRGNSTTGSWLMKPLGSVWKWIEWKIEGVLGLTASQYNGNAATASGYAQSGGIASALAAKSAIDHTHAVTLAESNASPDITLSPNSKYALTVAGGSVVIKTPPGPFFATYGLTEYGDFVQAYIAGCDIYVTYPYNSGGAHYLNVHKPQIVASEYNNMYSFIMVFDAVNMSSGTTGTIMWQLSQSGWKCYHNGTWESGTQYMYSPVDFYAPNLATKSDLNSYATIASLSDYATKTELNAVSRYGGQHASCLVKVNGNWSNEISGAVYDARGNNVGTFSGVGSIPSIINRTSDVVEIFMKVTSTYSGTGTVGFNFQDIAVEKPIRIHIRNSSGQTFRIRLRKESGETTTCTYYTATSADVGTYFNVDTPANSTSDWLIMVSGVESNACYCINRI